MCLDAQVAVLLKNKRVLAFLRGASKVNGLLEQLSAEQVQMVLSLPAMQQSHVLSKLPEGRFFHSQNVNAAASL